MNRLFFVPLLVLLLLAAFAPSAFAVGLDGIGASIVMAQPIDAEWPTVMGTDIDTVRAFDAAPSVGFAMVATKERTTLNRQPGDAKGGEAFVACSLCCTKVALSSHIERGFRYGEYG